MRNILTAILLFLSGVAQTYAQGELVQNRGINWTLIVLVAILVILLLVLFYYAYKKHIKLWFDASISELKLSPFDLFYFTRSKLEAEEVKELLQKSQLNELDLSGKEIFLHAIKKGNVKDYVEALVINKKAKSPIPKEVIKKYSLDKGDVLKFTEMVKKAKEVDIDVDYDLFLEQKPDGKTLEKIVNTMIKAKESEVFVSKKELNELKKQQKANQESQAQQENDQSKAEKDKKIKEVDDIDLGGKVSQQKLFKFNNNGVDIEKLVQALSRAKKAEIKSISAEKMSEYAIVGIDIEQLIVALIKAKNMNLTEKISLQHLIDHGIEGGDMLSFVNAVILGGDFITAEDLNKQFLSGEKDVEKFVKALKISKIPDIGFTADDVREASARGLNVIWIALSMLRAKEFGVELKFNQACMLNNDAVQAVTDAANPKTLRTPPVSGKDEENPPITVVIKDGIELKFQAHVTVLSRIGKHFSGSGEEALFARIAEGITHEVAAYHSHHEVVESIKQIADHVETHLKNDSEANEHSKFKILDLSIPVVEVGKDIYAGHKKHHAEIEAAIIKAKAEAKLKESEAEVEKAFAKAIESGDKKKMTNEYHKHRIYKDLGHKGHGKDSGDTGTHDDQH